MGTFLTSIEAILGIVGALLLATLAKLLADDCKEWMRWMRDRALARAISVLPLHLRTRYQEEWSADLERIPGEVAKLIFAIGLKRSAVVIHKAAEQGVRIASKYDLIRRLWELLSSGVMLLLLLPLFLVFAGLIKMQDGGPAFVRIPCVGKKGETFSLLQFRTRVAPLEETPTPIGFYLRRTALHVLPWLINVFRGELNFIGVRPKTASQLASMKHAHRMLYNKFGPGVASPSGICGVDAKIADDFDFAYLTNRSLLSDWRLMLRTAWVALRHDDF